MSRSRSHTLRDPDSNRDDPTMHAGGRVFSPEAWQRVTSVLALSTRESEILKAVFEDQKEHCIAANLGISSHTVHTHLERLYRKLRVSSRVGLVVRVFAEHLRHLRS
jgi:DNA-binding NarL/FixJ family response regulator